MKSKIYICCVKEDKETADRLYADLKKRNLTPWMKDKDVITGQNKEIEVAKAIQECSAFIALLSSRSVSKVGKYQKELRIAFDLLDERPYGDIFMIPVILDQCSRPDMRFENIHWADMSQSYESGLNQILQAIEAIHPRDSEIPFDRQRVSSPVFSQPSRPETVQDKTGKEGKDAGSRALFSNISSKQKVLCLTVAVAMLILTAVFLMKPDINRPLSKVIIDLKQEMM